MSGAGGTGKLVPPVADQIQIAQAGSIPERWNLATTDGIVASAAEILAEDPDPRILDALAGNYSVAPAVLSLIAAKSSALKDVVGRNPFAMPDLKEPVPLVEHAALGISRFLDDRSASHSQRQSVANEYERALLTSDFSVTLADAWARATETDPS